MPCHVLHSAHNINFLRTLATDLQSISTVVTFGQTTAQPESLFHVPDQAELLMEHGRFTKVSIPILTSCSITDTVI